MKHKEYLKGIYNDIKEGKITFNQFATAISNWVAENKELDPAVLEAEEEGKDLPGQEKLF